MTPETLDVKETIPSKKDTPQTCDCGPPANPGMWLLGECNTTGELGAEEQV